MKSLDGSTVLSRNQQHRSHGGNAGERSPQESLYQNVIKARIGYPNIAPFIVISFRTVIGIYTCAAFGCFALEVSWLPSILVFLPLEPPLAVL
ncbi:hypothetical protein LSM04_003591 [Trypanosoma melophagium]|uniref:uncharacterized protein n=1 Tax=Trypanosoma melophagium TaxID=715481 RepID=UPI00351AACB7|nr:hypothetical protein LSM04_003591 [Trypanosoma melophagium]